ncbi:mitochondrial ribonuclease Z [Andalucia godoyi]|uniref:Mitochondrial ribonuclease Z n=1 Tax=Andalucia godoyi TaxID=505711 RepID=A0A8K0AH75_ANDGO|nr:mitochondrial ribonuclease Z [Andalucia godoyi]|eukprot:ANDGO_00846.mRNA.1 mitochondrial ribonuclease Z
MIRHGLFCRRFSLFKDVVVGTRDLLSSYSSGNFDGFEVVILGTSGAVPTPNRGVSSTAIRLEGEIWLVDAGEGTQLQIQKSFISASKISKIFVTHLHGDHIFGLPGLLCHMAASRSPSAPRVEIYGPSGLRAFLRSVFSLSSTSFELAFSVNELVLRESHYDYFKQWNTPHPQFASGPLASARPFLPHELHGTDISCSDGKSSHVWNVLETPQYRVSAGLLQHRVPCFGFVFEEKEQFGALNVKRCADLGIPTGPLLRELKQGRAVSLANGSVIAPNDVLGPSRPGRKVVLLGDTSNSDSILDIGKNCDLLVHECTLPRSLASEAFARGHSTAAMAGWFARMLNASNLVLSHFSPRFDALRDYQLLVQDASAAFGSKNVLVAQDFTHVPIPRKYSFPCLS